MTPEEFNAMTQTAAERVDNLTEQGARDALALLEQVRKDLIAKLADAPTQYGEWYYNELLKDVQRLFADLNTRYSRELEGALDGLAEAVKQAVDAPLRAAGITVSLPALSRQTVEFLTGFQPGQLVSGLTQDARNLVTQELQAALLGTKTPYEAMQSISQLLGTGGRITSRVDTIWRTEAGRVFNVLAHQRYKRVSQSLPGRFKKRWLHSGNTRRPRARHVQLGSEPPIDADAQFDVNGYMADGPHDSSLPASETINCGCTSILVLNN